MDPDARGRDETARELARAALGIVALGAALGFAFHTLAVPADPRQRLAWIAHQTPIVSLESFAPVDTAAVTRAVASSLAPADSAAAPRAAAPAAAPAATRAVPAQTTAATPPAARPALALPFVPDTGAPLEVQYATARRFWDAGAALVVDARPADEYATGHIAGAVSLPFDDVQRNPDLAKQLDARGRAVVITYCGGGTCELSKELAQALVDAGRRKVLVFTGGLPGWQAEGGPVATGGAPGEAP